METVTYSQLQELVLRLPEAKLPLAYDLLAGLAENEAESLSPQFQFMLLPLEERQRIMSEQAEQMVSHYEEGTADREPTSLPAPKPPGRARTCRP